MSAQQLVIEIDHDSGHLQILALTQFGNWEPVLTLDVNAPEVISRYRTPLLLRCGYSHDFQSDIPHDVGDKRGVIPQDSRPSQS